MIRKIPAVLALLLLATVPFLGGCGENDPDLDPPGLTAVIDASGTGEYKTGDLYNAVDISGTVQGDYTRLEFDTDGTTAVVTKTSETGTTWSASVSNLQEGANYVAAVVFDDIGNRRKVWLLIVVDLTAPTVTVHQYVTPTPLTAQKIAGSIDDDAALLKIDGNRVPVSQFLWQYNVTGLTAGDNLIDIVATDTVGNSYNSTLTLTVDGAAPGLTIDPPAPLPATYNSFTLTGQRDGVPASDIALVISNGLTVTAPTVVNSATVADGWEALIDPLLPGVSLATATLYNTSSFYNSATVPTVKARIYLDGAGPQIASVYPAAGSVTAPIDAMVTFRFNERIRLYDIGYNSIVYNSAMIESGLGDLFTLNAGDVTGSLVYNSLTRTAEFTPNVLLAPATLYNAVLQKENATYRIIDLAGNAVDEGTLTDWSFTTQK